MWFPSQMIQWDSISCLCPFPLQLFLYLINPFHVLCTLSSSSKTWGSCCWSFPGFGLQSFECPGCLALRRNLPPPSSFSQLRIDTPSKYTSSITCWHGYSWDVFYDMTLRFRGMDTNVKCLYSFQCHRLLIQTVVV